MWGVNDQMTEWACSGTTFTFKHDILKESSSWSCHVCKSLEFEQIFLKKSVIMSWEPFIWFCEEVWIMFPMVENFLSSWGTFLIKHFWSKHMLKSNLSLSLHARVHMSEHLIWKTSLGFLFVSALFPNIVSSLPFCQNRDRKTFIRLY